MFIFRLPDVQIGRCNHNTATHLHRLEITSTDRAPNGLVVDSFVLRRLSQAE